MSSNKLSFSKRGYKASCRLSSDLRMMFKLVSTVSTVLLLIIIICHCGPYDTIFCQVCRADKPIETLVFYLYINSVGKPNWTDVLF